MKSFLITVILVAANANAQWAASPAIQSPVNGIQQAVLEKKYDQALSLIMNSLQLPNLSEMERSRIASIYSNLANYGKLKNLNLGWVLPQGISNIRIRVARIHQQGTVVFKLGMSGQLDREDQLDSLVVTKYPNIVVLDKNKKIGTIEFEKNEDGINFSMNSSRSQLPVPSGYYRLTMTNKLGEKGEGWFVLDDQMNASAAPSFTNLADGQVVNGTPLFTWNSFTSPEYRASEWRGNYLSIGKLDADSNWSDALGYWSDDDTEMTSVEVGKTTPKEGHAEVPLQNGNYLVVLGYNEVKRIGDVKFVRRIEVRNRFTVLNK